MQKSVHIAEISTKVTGDYPVPFFMFTLHMWSNLYTYMNLLHAVCYSPKSFGS